MVKRIPAGYAGSTQDAVGVVRFLLSEDARNVTGTTLYVDSGFHAMGM